MVIHSSVCGLGSQLSSPSSGSLMKLVMKLQLDIIGRGCGFTMVPSHVSD